MTYREGQTDRLDQLADDSLIAKKRCWRPLSVKILLFAALAACSSDESGVPCTTFFGLPGPNTGMSAEECKASCNCGDTSFDAPSFSAADIGALQAKELLDPPQPLASDPYAAETPPAAATDDAQKVCAVLYEAGQNVRYRLQTFVDALVAEEAGAIVTHTTPCGACSSLADLAVYAANPDLSTPVRECGLKGMGQGDQANLDCLAQIGFTPACATIWLYNTKNTRKACLAPCILALNEPFHNEDGSLNECLQCDEDISGPVFKAVAGRTRRNSGLASALCRPCDTVSAVAHRY